MEIHSIVNFCCFTEMFQSSMPAFKELEKLFGITVQQDWLQLLAWLMTSSRQSKG
jgi:hypothetical protein